MRRIEIISAVNNVLNALLESNLADALQILLPRPADNNDRKSSLPIEAMRSYFRAAEKFEATEIEIIRIMELSDLEEPEFWSIFTSVGEAASAGPGIAGIRERLYPMIGNVSFAISYLPKLVALLERHNEGFSADIVDNSSSVIAGKSIISATIIENENEYSKPLRLSGLFDSITELYEACAAVNDEPGDDLIVLACDSGSDKSFDFMGSAKIVEALKELILSIWDRAVFFREHKMSNHLGIVSQALPIIEQISTMEEQGKLGPEEAEILRKKVTNGAGKFLETGVLIPEMESVSSQNPRALMAPEPKQLVESTLQPRDSTDTGVNSSDGESQNQSRFDIKDMSKEERTRLLLQLQDEVIDIDGDGNESGYEGE